MPYAGSLPPASINGTWIENVEIWDTDTDELMDLSGLEEITLYVRDPRTGYDELTLTLSGGDIVIPSTGIIQWRAERGAMSTLTNKLYDVILVFRDDDDELPVVLGTISVI